VKTIGELLELAASVELPIWATHVAVRKDGSKAEPAAWSEIVNDYLDEDPANITPHCWVGSYNRRYWYFFKKDSLQK